MSGSNPFRHRKPAAAQPAPQLHHHSPLSAQDEHPSHSPPANHSPRIYDEAPSRPSPRQKTVRIASPPVPTQPLFHPSPGDHQAPANTRIPFPRHGTHRGSPPPPSRDDSSGSEDDSTTDPFNPDASGNEHYGAIDNKYGRGGPERESGVRGAGHEEEQALSASYGAEPTVFPRGQGAATSRGSDESNTSSRSASKGKRATMDVDAFTRMLMTGDTGGGKESVPATTQQPKNGPPISDSSSNTDAGSASKQPVFDRQHIPQAETPRTSHDLTTAEADEERRKLAALTKPPERQKPPPPKTRHGKPIKPNNTNQTSPLANPAPITSPGHRTTSPASISSPPLAQQPGSDANRPLPQPPVDNPCPSMSIKDAQEGTENPASLPQPQQKRPPTPPISRRHSQMKSNKTGISRNNSARLSLPPGINNLNPPSSHNSSPLKTPPPPPSRRKDRESSTFSSSDTPTPQEQPQSSVRRSSSTKEDSSDKSSLRSVETVSMISNKRASHGPPRPPPPRRGGGSRASLDDSRPVLPAGAEAANQVPRTTGMGTMNDDKQSPPITSAPSHATDILADLSRLQKEVDDLRGRYEGKKPGE
ncbi:hypothetical protein AJ79_08503 [Helicocarpus griseus UAMH5409]|uniref:Uncharacterized protein n=1 Tax=Helicocarpus griseus UAMH5409 TaxID=1447875 RepID=A0A2B7WSQ5_9EURO|nr:hypothetical protein AJ79_08503 [Helicocarpus griseus UAMH5409]